MSIRKEVLVNGQCYHIFSRSIAGFKIFNTANEYARILDSLDLYRYQNFEYKYSHFIDLENSTQAKIRTGLAEQNEVFVNIVAYCLMSTHIHLILEQRKNEGITKFIGRVLNSYSKFFNQKHKRNGPLWSSRFKSVQIINDEQLLHLTRYIHLNPTSAGLINNPEDWPHSSYRQYIGKSTDKNICRFDHLIEIEPKQYKKFVEDIKSYQQDLSIIKKMLIEDYTG